MKILLVVACSVITIAASPTVVTRVGTITGFGAEEEEAKDLEAFVTIPYAKPPLGDLRFALPEPFGDVGNFSADDGGVGCFQIIGLPFASENCLHLSVFRRKGTQADDRKAVAVVFHEGGYELDLRSLVSLGDVIAVTINYRSGLLGFANLGDLAPGNVGLFDQRLGLEWVKDNIDSFGGDPQRITVAGMDAGSAYIQAQIATPLNQKRQLFNAALMDAGFLGFGLKERSEHGLSWMQKIALESSCPTKGSEMLKCLRRITAVELNEAQTNLLNRNESFHFGPTIDGIFIPKHIDEMDANGFARIKLMVGVSKDEGSNLVNRAKDHRFFRNSSDPETDFLDSCASIGKNLLLPTNFTDPDVRRRIINLYHKRYPTPFECVTRFITDSCYICPANKFVEKYAGSNQTVYMYYFERLFRSSYFHSQGEDLGVLHGSGFANFLGLFMEESYMNDEDKRFGREAIGLFSGFMKTDLVPEFRAVQWPDFAATKKVLRIDENTAVADTLPRKENCKEIF